MDKLFTRLAVLATVSMFLVMIAGSLVTKTGSGLGCGNDWPLCNGKWVPAYTIESLIEYSHRLITGLAGLIVIVFSAWAWLRYKGNKEVRSLSLFGIFFIVLESLLGASAVIWPQSSTVLALHFGFSLLAYSGVFLLTMFVLQQRQGQATTTHMPVSKGLRYFTWGTALFAYGVVYLGAYVRHTGSNLGCSDWPLCNGQLIPELSGQVGIAFAHRVGAAVLFLMVLGMMMYTIRHYKETRRDMYKASIIAFILITLQVISGGLVIGLKLHLYVTMLHSAIITCLFGVLSYLCVQSLKGVQAQQMKQEQV